ncbi:hypothetical protein GCM10027341_44340 [Spirosoma knui]
MQRFLRRAALSVALLISSISLVSAQFRLDLESGVVLGTNYNDVRIPNVGGTQFDLSSDLSEKPKVFYRVRLGYTINNRHTISALYAPLTVRYGGNFNRDVTFNNLLYPAGQALTGYYEFNSYRLTYRYDIVARERWRVGLGLTAKIRDANIRLAGESNNRDTNFDNVGFVPLVNFYVAYRPTQRLGLLLEGDALGAKQGRAEDIFGGITYQVSDKIGLKGGYRVLEGGADTETIYNFTWINYASVGILATF